jgi:hypothetical protein
MTNPREQIPIGNKKDTTNKTHPSRTVHLNRMRIRQKRQNLHQQKKELRKKQDNFSNFILRTRWEFHRIPWLIQVRCGFIPPYDLKSFSTRLRSFLQ